ncbi:hypothetical protein Clacol_009798 [Clathrus columnatus]|uniref:beta-N-acetylhexosaminidase n=1 Tax=Clathrus columnatus TaxID=1419009 RepID=A0AAV5AUF7_9AGAM|nr:hypothetical protein Clacol_009798 [Clathrus columnatus]
MEILPDVDHRNSWCDPFKTWQKAYSFDPLANITESEQHLILGGTHSFEFCLREHKSQHTLNLGEQLLWTEQSGPENLDPIVWPRAAASAEVFWTGANRNVSEALSRLHEFRYRLVQRGVNAINLQPQWCALRPHECDLPFVPKIVIPKDEKNQIDIKRGGNKAEEHNQPFPVYLQNHVRKRIEDFFGFSPWPYGMHMTDDKTVSHEEKSKKPLEHQIHNHNGEEVIPIRPENSEKQKSKLKPNEEREPFGVFIQNHIKKRMADYLGPVTPAKRQEEL